MFLRRRVRPEIFTKLLAAFIIVYAAVLLVGIGYRTAIWDEFQNTALPFLLYDMTTNAGSIGPGFAALKAYAIDYQAHYAVFYSLIHHPPFHRIFLYAAFMLAGPGEVSGRAVSVAFAVLALVVTYMAAYRMTKRRDLSLLSSVTLALIPTFSEFSRLIMLEIPLVAMTTLTVYAFLRYEKSRKASDAILLGVAAGLCMLTKNYGLLVLVPLGLYMLVEGGIRSFADRKVLMALAVALAMAVPWYVFAAMLPSIAGVNENLVGAYVSYFSPNPEVFAEVPSFYLMTFSWILGPLSILAVVRAFMRRDKTDVLLLLWALSYFIFFMVAIGPSVGHLHRFIMPALPAFAILIARLMGEIVDSRRFRHPWHIIMAVLVCSAALSVAYNASVDVRKPMDEASVYILANSNVGDGVITTDFYQTFYLLKHDRDLKVFNLNARNMETLGSILNSTHASPARDAVGIKNPENYSYLVLEYPLQPKVEANPDFVSFIEDSGCLHKEKVFGNETEIVLYRFDEDCA